MFAIRSRAVVMTILVTLTGSSVYGYPTGAPQGACDTMTPNHGVNGQPSPAPYQLSLNNLPSFRCNETGTVKLTLTSSTGETFKGFLCQARTDPTKYVTTGTLKAIGGSNNMCSGNGSATHVSNSSKSAVQFEWNSTENNVNVNVTFVCTVVKSYDTFWVKGLKITFRSDRTACPDSAVHGNKHGNVGTWTTCYWATIAGLVVASMLASVL